MAQTRGRPRPLATPFPPHLLHIMDDTACPIAPEDLLPRLPPGLPKADLPITSITVGRPVPGTEYHHPEL